MSGRIKAKLAKGEIATGFKINLDSARAVEVVALSGFDSVWLDMEHIANDWGLIERQIWAAKARGIDAMVRVAKGSYSDYVRPLELDADCIMVPHVMSRREAESIVRMTKFQPIGRRALDGGNADGDYCGIKTGEYLRRSNETKIVIIQIEDPEAMEELDGIASVEGIDMIFFGPGDFWHGLGAEGNWWEHPAVLDARRKVAEAAIRHGKLAGTVASPESVKELSDMGYRFLNIGADVVGLRSYCESLLKNVGGGQGGMPGDSVYAKAK